MIEADFAGKPGAFHIFTEVGLPDQLVGRAILKQHEDFATNVAFDFVQFVLTNAESKRKPDLQIALSGQPTSSSQCYKSAEQTASQPPSV